MAGSGAKMIYPHNTNNNSTVNPYRKIEYYNIYSNNDSVSRNMEEDVIDQLCSQLCSANLNRQLQALDDLRLIARRNGGCFPYPKQRRVFDALAHALGDNKQDVRLQTTQLIHELIPQYGDNLDECMSRVVPKLVPNLGDSTIAIRRSTIQSLHVYMKYTINLSQLLGAIVQFGLDDQNPQIRKEVIVALPMLFTPEFSQEDFFHVAQSLAKKLLDSNLGEEKVKEHILLSLEKIRNLVGNQVYNGYIKRLSAPLRKYYLKLTNNNDVDNAKDHAHNDRSPPNRNNSEHSAFEYIPSPNNHRAVEYEFGVVPSHVMEKLNDQTNYRTRAQAVEELKQILRDMGRQSVDNLSPHVPSFISYLNNLLDDSNFKITTVTLEILGILVNKFAVGIRPHLKLVITCLTKRMGDNKIVIRQAIMKVVMQLMQILSPKPVLTVIADNLSNRNSRIRQETLNVIIASLLTFPSYDFDLSELCTSIAHTLVDPKRQVRQAALECFAVIAQAMGAGKLQPLVQAVDSVELSYEGDGVMAAVQARLTRRQLPKLNSDGLVDYATPVPSSGTVRGGGTTVISGPDIEWILLGAGGSGNSARTNRSESMELESLASNSARSTPSLSQDHSNVSTPRRHPSAGKNRTKLPWEDDLDGTLTDSRVKPRTTWGGEEFGNEVRKSQKKKGSNSRDGSPDLGSYQKIHKNRYQRQASDGSVGKPSQPYTIHGSTSNPDFVGSADSSPIPTKPALVRGVSSKRKVPPIQLENNRNHRDDDHLYYDDIVDDDSGSDDDYEDHDMSQSLRRIHNSASKKKVNKMFQQLDQKQSSSNGSSNQNKMKSPSESPSERKKKKVPTATLR